MLGQHSRIKREIPVIVINLPATVKASKTQTEVEVEVEVVILVVDHNNDQINTLTITLNKTATNIIDGITSKSLTESRLTIIVGVRLEMTTTTQTTLTTIMDGIMLAALK